jgi:hypothetical protein
MLLYTRSYQPYADLLFFLLVDLGASGSDMGDGDTILEGGLVVCCLLLSLFGESIVCLFASSWNLVFS